MTPEQVWAITLSIAIPLTAIPITLIPMRIYNRRNRR